MLNNDDDTRSQISSRSSQYSTVSIDQSLKEQATKILQKDCFLQNPQKQGQFETIPEEVDIQLGDDFETYNQRQVKHNTLKPQTQVNNQESNSQSINQQRPDYLLNKYDKKRFQITAKPDQKINDLQKMRQEALESFISPLQPQESGKKEGRKINMSFERWKYHDFISHDHENDQERQERRYVKEYPDYQSASIMSQINGTQNSENEQLGHRKYEQIHKTKVSPEYIKKMLNPENISEEKLELIKKLHQEGIDFRSLYQFRDKLFESSLNKEDKIPIEEYYSIMKSNLGDKLQNNDEHSVNILKISDFIDLYTYHPVRLKKDKNKSDDLYYILNSNQRGTHEYVNIQDKNVPKSPVKLQNLQFRNQLEKRLQTIMDLVGAKLMEKFNSFAAAFRYFDGNLNQSISFNEFYSALDYIGIKISIEDSKKIFDYLDTDHNNAVSYNEFCELSEEKRRGIDPFRSNTMVGNQDKSSRNLIGTTLNLTEDLSNQQPKNLYLSNINIDDLEQMSKLQSLSSLKKRKYKIQKQVGNLPKSSSSLSNYQQNNSVSYGKKSDLQAETIQNVINHNYLKDYLESKVARQAQLEAQLKSQKSKSNITKASELRSVSVAKILKRSDIERQIEDMKMGKGSRNEVSFIDIQKSHHKLNKELSLPPIKSALNASFNGSQTSKQFDRINSNISVMSRNNLQDDRSSTLNNYKSSPLTKRTDTENIKQVKRIDSINQEGVLDLIHKMRMQLYEQKDQSKGTFTEKPTSMTKREKEEILSNYYNAKKQLTSSNI